MNTTKEVTRDLIDNFLLGGRYDAVANAAIIEHIRRAVNSHKELLAIAKAHLAHLMTADPLSKQTAIVKCAISKAEGQQAALLAIAIKKR